MTVTVIHGDSLSILPSIEPNSFHSVVTDPPYHLTSIVKRFGNDNAAVAKDGIYARSSKGFMGKRWDGGDIAFRPETWSEVIRVMKPGAYMAAFASTRGYHRMACAIEDAGFIIHPMLAWIFGSGFPKATRYKLPDMDGFRYGLQALKPALEPICFAQKPMVGTGNDNWLAHGVGGINIDACRIETAEGDYASGGKNEGIGVRATEGAKHERCEQHTLGRWPANVLHDGSDEVMAAFAAYGTKTSGTWDGKRTSEKTSGTILNKFGAVRDEVGHAGDSGSAARFFYCAKADADDRAWSKHPTVKPLYLIRWLSRLITPPGGHVLDLFAGSGTTGEAARLEGFDVTLIEREEEYITDINRRLGRARGDDTPLFGAIT